MQIFKDGTYWRQLAMKKLEVMMETYGYSVTDVCELIVKDANNKQFERDLDNVYNSKPFTLWDWSSEQPDCKCGGTGECQCD